MPKSIIHKLDLEHFRGIRRLGKPIKLDKFTILIGANNSGKTTILDALSLLPTPNSNLPIFMLKEGCNIPGTRLNLLTYLRGGKSSSLVYYYAGKAKIT